MPNEYGIDENALVNGLLAGAKFRALQEDVKLSRLQRLEFEQTKGFRDQQRFLEMELGNARLNRENLLTEIGKLQQQREQLALTYAQEDRPGDVARKKAETSEARSRAKGARRALRYQAEDRPLQRQALEATTQTAQATASRARGEALGAALGVSAAAGRSLGLGSVAPELGDVVAFLSLNGVDEKAMPLLAQVMYGEIEGQKSELQQNQSRLKLDQERVAAEALRDKNAVLGQTVATAVNLASAPAGALEEYERTLPADDYYGRLAVTMAKALTPRTLSPGETAVQKALGEQLGSAFQSLLALQEERESATGGIFTSKASKQAELDKQIEALNRQIERIAEELDKRTKKGRDKSSESGSPLGVAPTSIPVVRTQAEYDRLPAGAYFREEPNGPVFRKKTE